jgi:hypothetical protein
MFRRKVVIPPLLQLHSVNAGSHQFHRRTKGRIGMTDAVSDTPISSENSLGIGYNYRKNIPHQNVLET